MDNVYCSEYTFSVLEDVENLGKNACKLRRSLENNICEVFRFVSLKSGRDTHYYEEPISKVTMAPQRKALHFEAFVTRWCTQDICAKKDSYEWWLEIDKSIFPDQWVSSHRWIPMVGFSFGNLVGLNNFVEHYNGNALPQCITHFEHDVGKLQVLFRTSSNLHSVEISYRSISKILVLYQKKEVELYLVLSHPVLLYEVEKRKREDKKKEPNDSGGDDHDDIGSESDSREETSGVDEDENIYNRYTHLTDIDARTPWIRGLAFEHGGNECTGPIIGMSTVFKLHLKFCKEHDVWQAVLRLIHNCEGAEAYLTPMKAHKPLKDVNLNFPHEYFNCRYALECVLSRSREVRDQIGLHNSKKFVVETLKNLAKKNAGTLEKALLEIHAALDNGNVVIFAKALDILFDRYSRSDPPILPESMILVRRAVVTPTRVMYLPPLQYKSSRLLKTFDSDYALKIVVKDDNLDKLSFTLKGTDTGKKKLLTKAITQKLLNGLKIGKVKYTVLGCSSSQLRNDGLWFYACDKQNRTAADIRNKLGDFHKIKHVPKYMARVGMFLSQAQTGIYVPKKCITIEEDITDGVQPDGTPYVFSDGIGRMSPAIAEKGASDSSFLKAPACMASPACFKRCHSAQHSKKISVVSTFSMARDLLHDSRVFFLGIFSDSFYRLSVDRIYKVMKIEDWRPSAVQIRYAGFKGMLVVDPTLESEGEKIVFRESMHKVDSDHTSLEILKLSAPRGVRLNRPFITILEQLHNSKQAKNVIFQMLSEDLKTLANSLIYDDDAAKLLRQNQLRVQSDGSSCIDLALPFSKLRDIGIPLTSEPFFQLMLHAIVKKTVDLLRTKACISVPFELGRNALGVLDESGTLEYGQVFFQYSEREKPSWNGPAKILTGYVLITKNPCMHPGDVRKFKAIDVEALHHIMDCIVFPKKGPRPHPDEMAGSDLDGDEYVVIWDQRLIFEKNEPPMHFPPPPPPPESTANVTEENMINFFCQYIMEQNIGVIASAHLAWADQLYSRNNVASKRNQGIFNDNLKEIARKYSISLDFAKRGESVLLEPHERVTKYPDFMEKYETNNTYVSNNLLGKLYHLCLLFEMCMSETEMVIQQPPDPTFCYPGWECYQEEAKSALEAYEKNISNLLATYNIQSEGEIITGCYQNMTKYLRDRDETFDLQELLGMQVKAVFESMQKRFLDTIESKKFGGVVDVDAEKLKLASAWYMVSYHSQSKYFGLPWTISKVICELKLINETERPATVNQSPLFLLVESMIECPTLKQIEDTKELDVALDILKNWMNNQEDVLAGCEKSDLEALKSFVEEKFVCVLQSVVKDGSIKALHTSKGFFGKLIIDTLQKMSEEFLMKYTDTDDARYELSLAALMTLGRIVTQRDISVLGIGPERYVSLKKGAKTRTVKFRISLQEEIFAEWAVHNPDLFKRSLQELTDVEELGIEPKQFKRCLRKNETFNNHTEKQERNGKLKNGDYIIDWYFLVTARGHTWALQQLRKFAIQEDFQRDIMIHGKSLEKTEIEENEFPA